MPKEFTDRPGGIVTGNRGAERYVNTPGSGLNSGLSQGIPMSEQNKKPNASGGFFSGIASMFAPKAEQKPAAKGTPQLAGAASGVGGRMYNSFLTAVDDANLNRNMAKIPADVAAGILDAPVGPAAPVVAQRGAPVGPGSLAGLLNEPVDPVPEEPRLALTITDFFKPKAPKRALAYSNKTKPKAAIGGQASGPAQSSDSGRGSAWGVSGSRPTGGGAGGERTGERSFYGR